MSWNTMKQGHLLLNMQFGLMQLLMCAEIRLHAQSEAEKTAAAAIHSQ